MIEQRPRNQDDTPGLWDTEEPGYVPRERAWHTGLITPGVGVVVQSIPVLTDGEDWTGYPPTHELTWDEWVAAHETTYGLSLDGTPVADLAERRAAWRKIRRMANGEATYTEANIRDAFGAVRRILHDLATEVTE
jgi:hypothetical protein